MHGRLEADFTLRAGDPLYVQSFANRDKIHVDVDLLPSGVPIVETREDLCVVRLIPAHGEALNAFVQQGFQVAQQPAPGSPWLGSWPKRHHADRGPTSGRERHEHGPGAGRHQRGPVPGR